MYQASRLISDPFNKLIYLIEGICDVGEEQDTEIYDDVSMAIQKPAICIEVNHNKIKEFYYFRSVGWQSTILIRVHFINDRWETAHCEKNPSNERLSEILKKGKQLL